MSEAATLIVDLLTYIEQVEKLKKKPAFSVPTEYFTAYQHELKGLPEIRFNLTEDEDDIWLRIPRLQESSPPALDEQLKPWVSLPKKPESLPEIRSEIITTGSLENAEPLKVLLADEHEIQELFNWYVENQWVPWAAAEVPRRKTISAYNRLYALQQLTALDNSVAPIELVWGIGFAAWKVDGYPTAIKHPLLTQVCEVTLNEKNFELEVRPRDTTPTLEVDCYAQANVPGVQQLESYWKSTVASLTNGITPFDSATFEGTLRAAVGYLDPTGSYEIRTDDVSAPNPDGKLKITNTWVLFGRKRSGDIFLQDIERLKKNVQAAQAIPQVLASFVTRGDDTVRSKPETAFRGLATSDWKSDASELYFPMPYNDEQVSIIQKLHSNDGVIVQGPPGTGKTHTIANVICHYLALGKRVLVTAKGESALSVLQDKLPEQIRPLSVSLLSDERNGMRQFEHSIHTIASMVSSMNEARVNAAISTHETTLNLLHSKISVLDRSVADFANKHMCKYKFRGQDVTPEEMAKLAIEDAEQYQWFDDEPTGENTEILCFNEQDINDLRHARIRVGKDLNYLACKLPQPDEMPVWSELEGLHRDLIKGKQIDIDVGRGAILALVDSTNTTFKLADALLPFINHGLTLHAKLLTAKQDWAFLLIDRFSQLAAEDPAQLSLLKVCETIRQLSDERRELISRGVEIGEDAEKNGDVIEAISRLIDGRKAFSLPFGKGEARKVIEEVKILGEAPKSKEDWAFVQKTVELRVSIRRTIARWNALKEEFGLPAHDGNIEDALKALTSWQEHVEDARHLALEFYAFLYARVSEVFGSQTADRIQTEGNSFLFLIKNSLLAHVNKGRLDYTLIRIQELLKKLTDCEGDIVESIRVFLIDSLGSHASEESIMNRAWLALMSELQRLTSLKQSLQVIERTANTIEEAGAPLWAKRIRTEAAGADSDVSVPTSWREAWDWRLVVMFLDKIDGHKRLRELFSERKKLSTALAKTYQDLVAEKTWLGVKKNSPALVTQALTAYLVAMQKIGAGTGVRAVRHRKNARSAMELAYRAVPCWVLPLWRVSETIPSEVGLFDLVIIDEASQADIWALPALMRGKKILVVGDDKQVSPSAVGDAEIRIVEITQRFLNNQPHGAQMAPDQSIYDLARVVFADNAVMLKEHFRSVPAIIEYSNREFYENEIKPLRLPTANERLDPPLVDVFVHGGFRNKDTNPPEAEAIVQEIESIVCDPQFDNRTIGVVTLLGIAQATLINTMLNERLEPSTILARKIAVGPPPVFQGRERDIMLISLVIAPGDQSAANRADIKQRFNVALSRARDRMYLFRSVDETSFKEDSLTGRLIAHFKQPFRQNVAVVNALREKCESGFELEMFDELVKLGYRVMPQVACGGYRIDFVVEGNDGRRLAIECDGDRFHGPGQWQDDMTRQRVLERAGWTFWRCFASSFVRNREEILADLTQTLENLGIEPLGSESVDNTIWVHHKQIDPYAALEATEETLKDDASEEAN